MSVTPKPLPRLTRALKARFWASVEKAGPDDCWLWQGERQRRGYGRMTIEKHHVSAHRLAYAIANHRDPGNQMVLHRCDNPPCCNPAHLFMGTGSDNVQDCIAKGRLNTPRGDDHYSHRQPETLARGERHGSHTHPERVVRGEQAPHARLTDDLVRQIRHEYATTTPSYKRLGEKYGVHFITIHDVIKRKTWRHVEQSCHQLIGLV